MRNCWPHWAEFDNWAPVLLQSGEQLDENLLVHRRERVEVLDPVAGRRSHAPADEDVDGVGSACDICPSIANAAQTEEVACIAIEEDGGDWRVLEAEWRSVGPADFL